MPKNPYVRRETMLSAGQVIGTVIALAGLAFAPPVRGRMFLLPLRPHAPVAALAVSGGARILASGPARGSLVVIGQRDHLLLPLLEAGILVMAAPAAGCGGEPVA